MRFQRLFLSTIAIAMSLAACSNTSEKKSVEAKEEQPAIEEIPTEEIADGDASKADHIVISKEAMTLKLYDSDNRLICSFGVAVGKKYGNKQRPGDMKTPEGNFHIENIQDASTWGHDFGDGKGYIANCYGNWFLRLKTPPHSGIGIHGTHDPNSIGTRATEGCIRLHNDDLDSLKRMVHRGMNVRIEPSKLDLKADGKHEQPAQTESAKEDNDTVTATIEPMPDNDTKLYHEVADGDRGGSIAKRYGLSLAELCELNPSTNIDKLSIGQKLVVGPVARSEKKIEERPQPVEKEGEVWHTVADNETLSAITMRYGVYWEDVLPLNPDLNPDRLSIGQRIRIK